MDATSELAAKLPDGVLDLELLAMGAAVLVLLAASAFFSGSETALTAASKARMHSLEQAGNGRAKIYNHLMSNRERLIGALLLGNTFVNILSSALATGFFVGVFGPPGVAYATIAMTLLLVIFGEVMPKTYAITHPDRMALTVAPAIRFAVALLSPINLTLVWIVRQLMRLLGQDRNTGSEFSAHDELRGAIDLHHKEGAVKKHDRDMLGGILDLRELTVSDIMVHRMKMETFNVDEPPAAIIQAVLHGQYSRIPVWRGKTDNIIGVLNAKDLLAALNTALWNVEKLDIAGLTKPAWFVPDTTNLKSQLSAFLKRKEHIAMVVDEYGVVQGLVALEDILEEIVGQIADEHDIEGSGIRLSADGGVVAEGSVPVRDLNRQMDWQLPDEEATTIAGLVIHEAQTIPEQGQAFTFHGYRFEILKKTRNRITTVKITAPARVLAKPASGDSDETYPAGG